MVKKILITMAAFAVIMIPCGGIISMFITAIVGGGVSESYIYPLYVGLILLAGLVAGCTCIIWDKLDQLEKKISSKCLSDL
jgi:hypothetical protein